MAGDIIEILWKLALPVMALSFLLMRWSLKSGRLKGEGNRKQIHAEMRALAKNRKAKGAKKTFNPIHNKWMRFGGGFYGAVALYTFFLIEGQEVINFLGGYEDFDTIFASFGDASFGQLLKDFFVNSIRNFVKAIAWPGYWVNGQQGEIIGIGFGLLYAGYWLGITLAKKTTAVQTVEEEA